MDVEPSIVADDGEKLLEKLDDVGAESEQFRAQHRRAIDVTGELSLPIAFGQQSGISIFSE